MNNSGLPSHAPFDFVDIREQNTVQRALTKANPDEEHKPRLPHSIAQPITNMPLSRMENTTFAKPSIIDSHDMELRTVLQSGRPKENAYSTPNDEGERILEKAWLVSPR
ncbi:hypothetical protein TNCV_964511 [Trichonephila clavipes]|nr:hypothetical protein TNCV_964511 [Trichonephila clavipes]